MPIGTGTAIALGIGAAGSLGGAAIAGHSQGEAVNAQTEAANKAAELQYKAQQEALAFQKNVFDTTQANQKPFLQAGQGAVNTLSGLVAPGGALAQPFDKQFTAPDAETFKGDPGYQFRLSEGMKALERSAASRGGLLSGGTLKAGERYAQNFASNEYGNAYDRALNEYRQSYDIFRGNQNTRYNQLAGLAGTGQISANALGQTGANAAGQNANILMGTAGNLGDIYQHAGAARASGYMDSGNLWGNAIGGLGTNIAQSILLGQRSNPYGGRLQDLFYNSDEGLGG